MCWLVSTRSPSPLLPESLVSGAAEQINFEIARQIISDIWSTAPVTSTFPLTPPSGISQQEHFRDFVFNLNQASNSIWSRTQKGFGNWIIVDEGAANLVESLPATMFQAAPRPASVQGLHFIGTLNNRYRVYKDLHLDKESGSAGPGNLLMGFKGSNFFDAGGEHNLRYGLDNWIWGMQGYNRSAPEFNLAADGASTSESRKATPFRMGLFRFKLDEKDREISFYDRGGSAPKEPQFTYELDGDVLRLTGRFEFADVAITLNRQFDETLLESRGFRWVNEYPFNR